MNSFLCVFELLALFENEFESANLKTRENQLGTGIYGFTLQVLLVLFENYKLYACSICQCSVEITTIKYYLLSEVFIVSLSLLKGIRTGRPCSTKGGGEGGWVITLCLE